ncbi:hypothetical protein CBM2586_A10644 [Cupriavidus phytorum]|uniref:Uncharacterized protein n=1 Tax=Cupriavidus taiwanensis TaxID=164546 RepID=A0A975WQ28_9BURK|nr:hypothetical protein CBM2586_A10644 [Cupriavidus taiwanensis]
MWRRALRRLFLWRADAQCPLATQLPHRCPANQPPVPHQPCLMTFVCPPTSARASSRGSAGTAGTTCRGRTPATRTGSGCPRSCCSRPRSAR